MSTLKVPCISPKGTLKPCKEQLKLADTRAICKFGFPLKDSVMEPPQSLSHFTRDLWLPEILTGAQVSP